MLSNSPPGALEINVTLNHIPMKLNRTRAEINRDQGPIVIGIGAGGKLSGTMHFDQRCS